MNTKLTIIRCPQLDRLNRNLIEAYRALEDREVFALAADTESPNSSVWAIHKAMEEHRRNCPFCIPIRTESPQLTRTIYFGR